MPIIKGSGPIDKVASVMTAVANHISSDLPILNEEQREERLKICRACDVYNKGWCDEKKGGCGCLLLAKTALPLEKCPLNPPKWDVHPDAQAIIDLHTKNTGVKIGECQGCPSKSAE